MSATVLRAGLWARALAERGFSERGGIWARAGFRAAFERGWFVLRTPVGEHAQDPLASDAEWPGLWRLVPAPAGLGCVFELPPSLVGALEHGGEEQMAAALAGIDWALCSSGSAGLQPGSGSLSSSSSSSFSSSPTPVPGSGGREEEEERSSRTEPGWSPALPDEPARVVSSGAVVAQVRALPAGAGFELPLTTRPLTSLAPERAAWMRVLLADARAHWRLVRCLAADGLPSARVDLRGAPPELAEPLAAAALDALRQVGAWLLEPLDLVLDPALDSPALAAGASAPDRSPRRARPATTRRARPATTRRARPASSQENPDGSLDDPA